LNTPNRNDPCPCGSGKKYKKCHMGNEPTGSSIPKTISITNALRAVEQLVAAGELDNAEYQCQQLIGLQANNAQAYFLLGVIFSARSQKQDAVMAYKTALRYKKDYFQALGNLGQMLLDLGQAAEAEKVFLQALAITSLGSTDKALLLNNLGNTLTTQGRLEEAVTQYKKAINLKADHVKAYANLGSALSSLGKVDEAIQCYETAIAYRPDYSDAYNALGAAYFSQRKLNEAIAAYKKATSLNPSFAYAHNNLGVALRELGHLHFETVTRSFQQALLFKPEFAEAFHNLFNWMQFDPLVTPKTLQAAYSRFRDQLETPLREKWRPHDNDADPTRRLRIGYVSPDFRRHAVAYFIAPILENHDKEQIELFCYFTHTDRDDFTDRLESHVEHWRNCVPMTDEQLAEQVRTDKIDILVDLAGHTKGGRLLMFAHKPAPIQMIYLGYPGSSGLHAIDYRLSDNYADPQGSEAYYAEQLLRLPDSLWCYRPDDNMPDITPLPAIHNGYMTFGSFNNYAKISGESIVLWAKLLHEIPQSRLLMVTIPEGEWRKALLHQFIELGIEASRLSLVDLLPTDEFQRTIQQADIALDPVIVNGATTTCEALWLGVPTLTLVGNRFLSRAGLSILSAAGIPEFAVATEEGYIGTAKSYAEDITKLAALRASLRVRIASSPLTDAKGFAQHLEQQYRAAWISWCNGRKDS